jgi:hypothetical protein
MADLNVNFMHPTDGRVISVTVDSTMTGREAIGELIANDFIPASSDGGYKLRIKGGIELDTNKSLSDNQVRNNDTLGVILALDAGFVHI